MLGQDIQSLDWMTPATKQQALVKLRAVTNKIGYPDKWRDYSSVKIVRGQAVVNDERASEFEVRRTVEQDRPARGSRRMEHDAAHRECLLRSAA